MHTTILKFPEDPTVMIEYFRLRDQADTTFCEKVHTVDLNGTVMKVVIFEGSKVYASWIDGAQTIGNFQLKAQPQMMCYDLTAKEFLLDGLFVGPNGLQAITAALQLDILPDQLLETIENNDVDDLQAVCIAGLSELISFAKLHTIHSFPWDTVDATPV